MRSQPQLKRLGLTDSSEILWDFIHLLCTLHTDSITAVWTAFNIPAFLVYCIDSIIFCIDVKAAQHESHIPLIQTHASTNRRKVKH